MLLKIVLCNFLPVHIFFNFLNKRVLTANRLFAYFDLILVYLEKIICVLLVIFVLMILNRTVQFFFFKKQFDLFFYLIILFALLCIFFPLFLFEYSDGDYKLTLFRNSTNVCSFSLSALIIYFVVRDRKKKKAIFKTGYDASVKINKLIRTITEVKETERERISRDLHDDVGASMSALKLHLTTVGPSGNEEDHKRSVSLITKIADDMRLITHDLMLVDFSNEDLLASLLSNINDLNKNGKIKFTLITECDKENLDRKDFAVVAYRIVMELVNNIIKHSNALEASVQIAILPSLTQIIVEDHGSGMKNTGENGIGLRNIYSRVEYLKGKVTIDSSYKGTTVIIIIPEDTYEHD